jgi:hypothetical protein
MRGQCDCVSVLRTIYKVLRNNTSKKSKAVPLHAMEALGGRESIAPTHSRPR